MSAPSLGTVSNDFVPLIEKVSQVVHKISGNRLGEKQSYMVETRVKKRMMELGLKTPADYLKYLDSNIDFESNVLVGLLTTHHTFFFREFPHFEILKTKLPEIVASAKKRNDKVISVWSAACSRGHEVYSLAMFLDFHLPKIDPTMSFKILGTDIDDESVKIANNGVYHQNEIKEIPMNMLSSNWANGTAEIAMYSKVKGTLKSKCTFKKGNLLKIQEAVKDEKFDIIFCRNVFIYFESHQVEMISKDLLSHLRPDGVFFSGISEPLSNLKLDILAIGPSAYVHKTASKAETTSTNIVRPTASNVVPMRAPVAEVFEQPILRVMCVDDSPSILTLLKKVLTKEQGFEIVATAINGRDAMEKMRTVKVDLMTLDIHMPEMDGVTYLEKNYNKSHPPVMIISSASRGDTDTAMRALRFGASDYVEKPALTNLEERGEEIRTKLRSLAQDFTPATDFKPTFSQFDKENQKHFVISRPENKMRLMIASLSDIGSIKKFFYDLDQSQPPTIVFFEGQGELLEGIVKEFKAEFKKPVCFMENVDIKLEVNTIYFADFKKTFAPLQMKCFGKPTSILAYGNASAHAVKPIMEWKGAELLVEDLGVKANSNNPLAKHATDIVPATSFPYMSCRYLSQK
jgi:chemotaxis protein methyltransferase CheR